MTPQELKNSIIQLAMQGRLVDQIESERTGDDLLHQIIRARKQLGIRDNKKVEPITEDILPFEIPLSWCWARFGEIVTYNMGKTPPRAETQWWENDFPWVSIADMPENGHITSTKEGVSRQAIVEKFGNRFSPAGTMIMSFKLTVGRVSILDIDAVHNEAIISIFPLCDSDNCLQQYLFHLLPTITQYGDSKNAIKGKTLNDTSISNLLIPLPPLAEQKRIVAKIEELLPLIDRYEQAWTRLEDFNKRFPGDMQKSILQMAIQGKLVEQRPEEGTGEELYQQIQKEKATLVKEGKVKKEKPLTDIAEDEIPFDIPDSWKWVRIASITTLNPKNELPDDYDTGFIPMPCVADGYRNEHTYEVKKWGDIKKGFTHFADGDIGVAKITPCFQNRKSVIFKKLPGGFGAGTTELSIVRIIENMLVREYLLWFFKTEYFISNGKKSFTGTAGQQRIHKDYLATCLFPLPPIDEQKRIVTRLEELLPLCERLK